MKKTCLKQLLLQAILHISKAHSETYDKYNEITPKMSQRKERSINKHVRKIFQQ